MRKKLIMRGGAAMLSVLLDFGNGTSFKGAETKPTKGTFKNVCPFCANPSYL